MGKKLDEAYSLIRAQAEHHLKLSQKRDTEYDSGFAQGFYEALLIVSKIRG